MNFWLFLTVSFVSGALPFSVWVGKLALHQDIRQVGDGNPGATNVLRAGNKALFAIAAILDYTKALIPVGVAHLYLGYMGWQLVGAAVAPLLGHAFSPFLGFHGGKAVAATMGAWTGLTIWEAPTVLGFGLGLWFTLIANSGWAVVLAMLTLLVYLSLTPTTFNLLGVRPSVGEWFGFWVVNMGVLAWKYRADLGEVPAFRKTKSKR